MASEKMRHYSFLSYVFNETKVNNSQKKKKRCIDYWEQCPSGHPLGCESGGLDIVLAFSNFMWYLR